MKRRVVKILLVNILLVLAISGCKDSTSADKKQKEETATAKVEESIDDEVKKADSAEKDTLITDSSITPDTNKPEEPTTINSTKELEVNNTTKKPTTQSINTTNTNATVTPSNNQTQQHTHTWIEVTQTITHPEEGHWVSGIDKEWEKEHYAWRTFCNKCGADITGTDVAIHSAIICQSGYHADYVIVKPYEGLPVMKEEWVVDKAAWTETVITGYKCECGATK